MLGIFAHNFKTICRLVTCDRHCEFNILTFSIDETRQSACIGLHRNVSIKKNQRCVNLKAQPTEKWASISHRTQSERSGTSRSECEDERAAIWVGPRSPNVSWRGCPRFLHKSRKTQSPRGPDPRWPSLFERILAFEEGVGAHSEPCTCSCPYVTRYSALKPRSQKITLRFSWNLACVYISIND